MWQTNWLSRWMRRPPAATASGERAPSKGSSVPTSRSSSPATRMSSPSDSGSSASSGSRRRWSGSWPVGTTAEASQESSAPTPRAAAVLARREPRLRTGVLSALQLQRLPSLGRAAAPPLSLLFAEAYPASGRVHERAASAAAAAPAVRLHPLAGTHAMDQPRGQRCDKAEG